MWIKTRLKNKSSNKSKWFGFILLLFGAVSCASVRTGLESSISKVEAKLPEYGKISPFYTLPIKSEGNLDFFVDLNGFWKEEVYNVETFYSFNLNDLIFLITDDDTYRADFTLKQACYDREGNFVFDKKWDDSIIIDNYESTRVKRVIIKRNVFQLEPGEYKISYFFEDKNSGRNARTERANIVIEPFEESNLVLSDIGFADYRNVLLEKEEFDSLKKDYENMQHANRIFEDSLNIFYEIYNNEGPVTIEYSVFDRNGKQVLSDSLITDSVKDAKTIHFDLSDFSDGLFIFVIKAYSDSLSTAISKQFAIYKIKFDIRNNFEETVRLIDSYINYSKGSLKRLKESKPGKERREAWKEFWKQFDPTTITEKNEYLDEFARRINFANTYFRAGVTKGSRSDMGMVYICLGPPNEAYYEPMPKWGHAYEVWEYYRGFRYTSQRRFVFYDEVGVGAKGDYRLVDSYNLPRWFEY